MKYSCALQRQQIFGHFDYNFKTLKMPVVNLQRICLGGRGQSSHTVIIFDDM